MLAELTRFDAAANPARVRALLDHGPAAQIAALKTMPFGVAATQLRPRQR